MRSTWISAGFLVATGLTASTAWAITADDIVTSYQAYGYSSIEVTTGVTQIKVEAVKDGTKLEVVYDIESGEIVAQESKPARQNDATDTTVELQTTNHDFTSADGTIIEGRHGHERGVAKGYHPSDDSADDVTDDSSDDSAGDDSSASSGEGHGKGGKEEGGHRGHGASSDDASSDDSSSDSSSDDSSSDDSSDD
jgi:hypothetical protein